MMRKFFVLTAVVLLFILTTAMKEGDDDSEKKQDSVKTKKNMAQNLLTHNRGRTHSTSIQEQMKEQNKSGKSSPIPESGVKDNVMLSDERPEQPAGISFEVIDLSEKENDEIMKELLTHRAEGKFYYRKVEAETGMKREKLKSAFDEFIEDMEMDSSRKKAWQRKTESWFSEKPLKMDAEDDPPLKYRITSTGEYEYYDGRKIVGDEEIKEDFEDGYKPLAKLVFYYEVRDKGLLKKEIGPREFLSLSIEKQRELIKDEPIITSR